MVLQRFLRYINIPLFLLEEFNFFTFLVPGVRKNGDLAGFEEVESFLYPASFKYFQPSTIYPQELSSPSFLLRIRREESEYILKRKVS